MCGIAGYIGTIELPSERVRECRSRMGRRGPDNAEVRKWELNNERRLYLLHSRLSIIDLDPRSNQPMQFGDKWIVQNGELYNYVERRRDLERDGIALATHSDTEVLLATLSSYGWRALDRCEGMWAFALFDSATGTLTLCRDRFGEKPLYLYRAPEGLYFASEIKFIMALLGRRLDIDREHLRRYLVNGYKSLYKTRRTFFAGVEELASGSLLEIDAEGRETSRRFWTPTFAQHGDMSFEEAVQGAREKLINSVELRLRADVPLAFCMSGGVDSVALISIAKRVFGYDVHGFTVLNSDARYEEAEMVERTVAELAIRHTGIPVTTSEFLPRLRALIRYHDAPVYTITYYAHWLLMESIAAHGYRISVSGSAADELFSGYYDHHLAYLYEVRHDDALHGTSQNAWREHVLPIVRNAHLQNPDLFIENRAFREHLFDGADDSRAFLHRPWREEFSETDYTGDLLRNRMANELFHEAVPIILHEDDLNAMYWSIENRSPFLDRDLFDFCNSIPTRHLIRDGRAKAVLREAMRGIAPDPVMENRRKVGFNAPIFSFLDVRDEAVRAELLADSPIFGIVRRDRIEHLLQQPDLPNSGSKFLFNFVCAKVFLEEFGEPGPSAATQETI